MNVKIILFSVSISTCALSMEPQRQTNIVSPTPMKPIQQQFFLTSDETQNPSFQPTQQTNQCHYQNNSYDDCDDNNYYYQAPFSYAQAQHVENQLNAMAQQQLQITQNMAQTQYNMLQELRKTNRILGKANRMFETLLKENNNLLRKLMQESIQNNIINASILRCLSQQFYYQQLRPNQQPQFYYQQQQSRQGSQPHTQRTNNRQKK